MPDVLRGGTFDVLSGWPSVKEVFIKTVYKTYFFLYYGAYKTFYFQVEKSKGGQVTFGQWWGIETTDPRT